MIVHTTLSEYGSSHDMPEDVVFVPASLRCRNVGALANRRALAISVKHGPHLDPGHFCDA